MFLHVPKTGGTSLVQALSARFDPAACFTDNGNISAALLCKNAGALKRRSFFHGHAEHGTLALLQGARTLTLLRRPEDHAISHYLYLQHEPGLPLHWAARDLDFPSFLRSQWQSLVLQCISLDVGLSDRPIDSRGAFFQRLPAIQALLARIDFVDCLDQVDRLLGVLARGMGWPRPAPLPRLHTADARGVDRAAVETLRAQYRELWHDPETAPLMAAEHCLYEQAGRQAQQQAAKALGSFFTRDRLLFPRSVLPE